MSSRRSAYSSASVATSDEERRAPSAGTVYSTERLAARWARTRIHVPREADPMERTVRVRHVHPLTLRLHIPANANSDVHDLGGGEEVCLRRLEAGKVEQLPERD